MIRHYGFTKEYLEGKRAVYCTLLDAPCRRGYDPLCKSAGCDKDKFAEWRIEGCTRQDVLAYWVHLQRYEDAVFRRECLYAGIQLDDADAADLPTTAEEAENYLLKRNKDPLFDFPNDVDYSKAAHNSWPSDRNAAFNGKDVIAKRASVNSTLWKTYTYMREELRQYGKTVTEEHLKAVLLTDISLAKLLPSEVQLMQYGARVVDGEIPDKHVATLLQTDALRDIMKKFNTTLPGVR